MKVHDIEHARECIDALATFLEQLKEDDDPGDEGLSIASIDDALNALALVAAIVASKR